MRRGHAPRADLGLTDPFLWKTVEWVVSMWARDPELVAERPASRTRSEARGAASPRRSIPARSRIKDYLDGPRGRHAARGGMALPVHALRHYGFPMDLGEESFRTAGWR